MSLKIKQANGLFDVITGRAVWVVISVFYNLLRVVGLEKELVTVFLSDLECEESEEILNTGKAVLQKLKMIAREHLTDIPYVKVLILSQSLYGREDRRNG